MNALMEFFKDMFGNFYLMSVACAWILAQIIKIFTGYFHDDHFNMRKFLFGTGGMPSSHSATVMSLVVASAIVNGAGSYQFAASLLLAIIVMSDAMVVRLETGKQAQILNEIIDTFSIFSRDKLPEVQLKEFVGHTPVQVAAGITIGIINACIMYYCIL